MWLVFKALNSYWCLFDGPCCLLGLILSSEIPPSYLSTLTQFDRQMKKQQRQHVEDTAQPPFLISLSHLGAENIKTKVKLSLGKKEKRGEGVSRFRFYFSLLWSDWYKLNSFSPVKSVLPMTVMDHLSLPVCIWTQEPSVTASLSCPGEEGSDRVASTDFQTVLEQPVLHKHLSSSLLWKKKSLFQGSWNSQLWNILPGWEFRDRKAESKCRHQGTFSLKSWTHYFSFSTSSHIQSLETIV